MPKIVQSGKRVEAWMNYEEENINEGNIVLNGY